MQERDQHFRLLPPPLQVAKVLESKIVKVVVELVLFDESFKDVVEVEVDKFLAQIELDLPRFLNPTHILFYNHVGSFVLSVIDRLAFTSCCVEGLVAEVLDKRLFVLTHAGLQLLLALLFREPVLFRCVGGSGSYTGRVDFEVLSGTVGLRGESELPDELV